MTDPVKRLMRRLTLPKEVALMEDALEKTYTFRWKWFLIKNIKIKHNKIRLTSTPRVGVTTVHFYINGHRLHGYSEVAFLNSVYFRRALEIAFGQKLTRDLNTRAERRISTDKSLSKEAIKRFYGVKPIVIS